jgi:ABC-type phosphate transport system substrate-binding protein
MKPRMVLRVLLVVAIGMASLVAPSASTAQTGSEITKTWLADTRDQTSHFYDEFKDFEVTVSQTRNLSNQGVKVSWSGLDRTMPGELASNYVQIMQCWGDETGPTPQQCQWGSPITATENLMGSFSANRDLMRGEDPKQPYNTSFLIPPPVNQPFLKSYRVPFNTVSGESTYNFIRYFSNETSNEFSAAPTGVSGGGEAVFEIQTSLEAPHLGCGAQTATGPRGCWLAVVPRGELRANGTRILEGERLNGSPLSASNWANRVQIPLSFSPLTVSCALGNSERRVVGTEMISAAFYSWQPSLCKDIATFGYSQIGDGEARRQITGSLFGSSGLAFIADPIDDELKGKNQLVYAPVANSAVVVAFNIEKNFKSDSPLVSQNGSLVTELKLNARLVAKLLTQSYRNDVPGGNNQEHVKDNPRSLVADPEFIQLNPDFEYFQRGLEPGGLLVALGSSDSTALVWRWLQNDPKANAFLKGTPDQWGMKLNKYYSSLELATDTEIESFPKADLSTYRPNSNTPEPGFSTLDMRPYSHDMLDAAAAARRGDSKSKTIWDPNKLPPAFSSGGAQPIGQRFMLAITDLPAAERYGLGVATLVSSTGQESKPTAITMNAAVSAMPVDASTGISYNDGKSVKGTAYPWTSLTYAVVNVCTQTSKALSEYSSMLNYAAGPGQVAGEAQGMLPYGYVPLPANLKAQAKAVATSLLSSTVAKNCPSNVVPEEEKPNPTPTPTVPVDPGPGPVDPVDPLDPGSGPRADAFKTLAEGSSFSSTVVLASLIFGFPGLVLGQVLLARSRKRKEKQG